MATSPYSFDPVTSILCRRFVRAPSYDEAAAALADMAAGRGCPIGDRLLWDLTGVDFTPVRPHDLASLVSLRSRYPAHIRAPLALVAATVHGFGMCRMFQIMSEVSGNVPEGRIGVFYDMAEARRWLAGFACCAAGPGRVNPAPQ